MEATPPNEPITDQDRVLLLFGYLGPLSLVSLIASRREFVKWHAKQGVVLWLCLAAVGLVLRFLLRGFDRYLWSIFGELLRLAVGATVVGFVVALLVCVVRAFEGERFRLPLIGDWADRL